MSERAPLLGNNTSDGTHQHAEPSIISSCKYALLSSYFNVFLIFVPIALVASFLNWSDTIVFSLNFIAIMPLAKLLGVGE
jgi:Ca2+:H+ antiporter